MSATIEHEQGTVYRLEIRGMLRQADLGRSQQALGEEIGRVGRVRVLVLLEDFEGWDPREIWNDLTFFTRYGSQIERIAIVGPERWRRDALRFAIADLRKGLVQYFPAEALDVARQWLSE